MAKTGSDRAGLWGRFPPAVRRSRQDRGTIAPKATGTDSGAGSSARPVLVKLGAFFRIGLSEQLHETDEPFGGLKRFQLGPL
ncbi:hypothetical protein [Roseibium sp. MB-4]